MLLWLLGITVLLSFWRLGDLGFFIWDASAVDHAIAPHVRDFDDESLNKPFFPKHNCYTSYAVAQQLATEGEANIYGPDLYRNPKRETPVHAEIGDLLSIDRYQYPPPFLLLPWLLDRIGGGFWGARSLFFLLTLGAFALCLLCLQRWLRNAPHSSGTALRVWTAWPLVLLASTTLATLQFGNVHALVMILAVLGMLAVVTGRHLTGGALLGFTVASKISPGLLLVYLLARGKWKGVAWTAAFGAIYTFATWLLFGVRPFTAFFGYQFQRLASGEAFSFAFSNPRAMLVNSSFTGIPYRLQQIGVLDEVGGLAKGTTWIAGFILLGCAWYWGRAWRGAQSDTSDDRRFAELGLWLVLLLLAQMRSPFLPWSYGSFVVLWLLAVLLVAPKGLASWRVRAAVLLPLWFFLSTPLPLPFGGPTLRADFFFAFSGTALALALAVAAVIHARRTLHDEATTS